LTNDGVLVNPGSLISRDAIVGNKLKFTPAANANGANYASFTFRVQDNGGIANNGVDTDPTARIMAINVVAVPDEPRGANRTITIDEDQTRGFTALDFGFADLNDTPADELRLMRPTLPR
jgi:hypothetical protein